MKTACKNCPFRIGSPMGYDPDAMEALDEGYEPSCHATAGVDLIFALDWPTESLCAGYRAWTNDEPGFRKPTAVRAAASISNSCEKEVNTR